MTEKVSKSELQKLTDPNFLVEVALGPPNPRLVPQKPGTGITLGQQWSSGVKRFLFKKAHLSLDDNRIFDGESGELVLVTLHAGKNPYDSLDPLGVLNTDSVWSPFGEWASICYATGYHGMPSFKVRPKTITRHGRQYVQDPEGNTTYINIAKQSRFKTKSIRHNLVVCHGDGDEVAYKLLVDLTGRTMQLVNTNEELVAVIEKSVKTLIMNASFGAGSELEIEVAPGVDWTVVLAILIGLKQVGEHFVKDALSNFVVNPATNAATGAAIGAVTGGDLGALTEEGKEQLADAAAAVDSWDEGINNYEVGGDGDEGGSVLDSIVELLSGFFAD